MKWRAEKLKYYYFITVFKGELIILLSIEENSPWETNRFKQRNFFRTKKEAQAKLKQILKVLKS